MKRTIHVFIPKLCSSPTHLQTLLMYSKLFASRMNNNYARSLN